MSVTVLHRTAPKARKPHQCDCCYRRIESGETYERQHNVFDGQRYSYLICAHCLAATKRVLALPIPPWWLDDGMSMDVLEEALCDYAQTWTDLRILVGLRRRWTHRNGSLWPVPVHTKGSES